MSISAIGGSQQVAYTQSYSSQSVNNQAQFTGAAPPTGGAGNSFFQAIGNALSQLGVSQSGDADSGASATSATTKTSGTAPAGTAQTPDQALQAFVQSLLAAIQSQVSGQSGSGSSTQAGGGHHHHGGLGKLESGIQNLIQQLGAASSGTTPTTTAGTTGSGSSTAVSPTSSTGSTGGTSSVGALQSSFNNLLNTDGISGNSATLTSFLQNLEKNLQGSGSSGNLLQAQA